MTIPATMLMAGLMPALCLASADEPFFPDLVFRADKESDDFIIEWYSKHLKAMEEPSLGKLSRKDPRATDYRFLWLPTFDRPVSVRLVKTDEGAVLHAVELDGKGGCEPGKIAVRKRVPLSEKQWEGF